MKTLLRISKSVLVVLIIMFISCKKENKEPNDAKLYQKSESENEIAYKDIAGENVEFRNEAKGVTFSLTKKGDKYIMGGDIILSAAQVSYLKGEVPSDARTGTNSLALLWPDRTVFFTINASVTNQTRITDAIAHWEDRTNLEFVQRTTEADYIEFMPGSGCASELGMVGGRQEIIIGSGCTTGNMIHEIGHAIGFFHEQSRSDRDDYITVNYGNVIPGAESQFYTYTQMGLGGFEIGSLEFNSVMMYGSYAFSNNGFPTITRLNGSVFFEQRDSLSAGDIQTYNNMYNRAFLRLESFDCASGVPIQDGIRDLCFIAVKAYSNAAMTIPANLSTPLVFKTSWEWERTGLPLEYAIHEKTLQPGQDSVYIGMSTYDIQFLNGQIYESRVSYYLDPLME